MNWALNYFVFYDSELVEEIFDLILEAQNRDGVGGMNGTLWETTIFL